MSAPAASVVRAGTRFIVAGNTTTTMETRRSNDGSAWSSGGTVTSSGMEGGSVTGAWNGTIAMFVAKGNVTGALTTPDGVALTQRTLPAALQTAFIVAKGTTFLVGTGAGGAGGSVYTTDTGAPGSFTTIPTTTLGLTSPPVDAVVVGSAVIVVANAATVVARSENLATWVLRPVPALPGAPVRAAGIRPLTADGARAYWSSGAATLWTTDGLSWRVRSVAAAGAGAWHVVAGRAVVPTGNQSPLALKTADWTVADFVGSSSGADINAALSGYMRIR
jgi:hypothetical protein